MNIFKCFCGNKAKTLQSNKCSICNSYYIGESCKKCPSRCLGCGKDIERNNIRCDICERVELSVEELEKVRKLNIKLVESEKIIKNEQDILNDSNKFFKDCPVIIGNIIDKMLIQTIIYHTESKRFISREKCEKEPDTFYFFIKDNENFYLFLIKYILKRTNLYIISPTNKVYNFRDDKNFSTFLKSTFYSVNYITADIHLSGFSQIFSCILIAIAISRNIDMEPEFLIKSAKFYWKNEEIEEKEEISNLFIPRIIYPNSFLRVQKVELSNEEKLKLFNNFSKCLSNILKKVEESEITTDSVCSCEDTDTIEIINLENSYIDRFPHLKNNKLFSSADSITYLTIFINHILNDNCHIFKNDSKRKKNCLTFEVTNQFIQEKGISDNFLEDFINWFRQKEFIRSDYIFIKNILNSYENSRFDNSCYQNDNILDNLFDKICQDKKYHGLFIEREIFKNKEVDFDILNRIIGFISFNGKECSTFIKKDIWINLNSRNMQKISNKDAQDAFKNALYIFIDEV